MKAAGSLDVRYPTHMLYLSLCVVCYHSSDVDLECARLQENLDVNQTPGRLGGIQCTDSMLSEQIYQCSVPPAGEVILTRVLGRLDMKETTTLPSVVMARATPQNIYGRTA